MSEAMTIAVTELADVLAKEMRGATDIEAVGMLLRKFGSIVRAESTKTQFTKDEAIEAVFNQLAADYYANQVAHQWPARTVGEDIALMHSELSEALEEHRDGRAPNRVYWFPENTEKPEGIPIELADCVIRILAFCGQHNINLGRALIVKHNYNLGRPARHGNKRL